MDAWVPIVAAGLYAIVITSFAFSILAVVYAYRLSRITGLFSAWLLLIGGLAITAFEDFAYFGAVVFAGYSKVLIAAEAATFGSILIALLFLVAIPSLFFGAMYKLHVLFKDQRKPADEARTPQKPLVITQQD
jgi:hypothetical protein